MFNKKCLIISLALFISILAACSNKNESEENNNEAEEAQADGENFELPEPNLENIPDVVAKVNGEEISKEEFELTYTSMFQQIYMQSQMTGEEVDEDQLKEQTIEEMVSQELLIQEADNAGIEASDDKVEETLQELVDNNGMESKEQLLEALEEQGMDEQEVMNQLKTQVKVTQLIENETGDVEPTEEELQELYDEIVAQQEQMQEADGESVEVPNFEEMKPDLVGYVEEQKTAEAAQNLIEKLRDDADVEIYI